MENNLYYGDNLDILRNEIASDSVDLIYLDPPFNSNATYNVLFKTPEGEKSHAQIEAFDDTWHWHDAAERSFDEVIESGNTETAEMLRAMRSFLKENDMMAYLTMMAVRLVELHRVLKPTGSLYLHCDPTASHYLKILLDTIFGKNNFLNEIIWHKNSGGIGRTKFSKRHDTLLFYAKSENYFYDGKAIGELREQDKGTFGGYFGKDPDGREYREVRKAGKVYKYYMDEPRNPEDVWEVPQIPERDKTERLGYPTQKPLALLERIILASSKEGNVVLDPFCGCGTAIHAAQKLHRKWIGVDITHLAISLIEKRLKDAFPDITFAIHGTPKDLEGACALAQQDKYQFQWWAVSLVDALPYGGKKKGADSGIDGLIYFKPDNETTEKVIVSVKGGDNVGVAMVRDLAHVVEREQAKVGIFITLADPTGPMKTEAVKAGFFESPHHGKIPKLQILTIEELFAGKKPQIPFVEAAFKKAVREKSDKEQGKLLQ